MPILKIEKLTKKYGKTYALNGLDMEVKKGDIYGFVGPNGAGKTTTLRIISDRALFPIQLLSTYQTEMRSTSISRNPVKSLSDCLPVPLPSVSDLTVLW